MNLLLNETPERDGMNIKQNNNNNIMNEWVYEYDENSQAHYNDRTSLGKRAHNRNFT